MTTTNKTQTLRQAQGKTLEELIEEYKNKIDPLDDKKVEAFIKKAYEAGGEAEREKVRDVVNMAVDEKLDTYKNTKPERYIALFQFRRLLHKFLNQNDKTTG